MTENAAVARQEKEPAMPMPLYHKILLILKERIAQGYYGANDMLPSEHDLSREFGVSRITISRSLRELSNLGLVERRRGSGTRVVSRGIAPRISGDIDRMRDSLIDLGKRSKVRLLEYGFVTASPEVQSALEIERGSEVQCTVRVRSYEGVPFSYLVTHLPEPLGRKFSRTDMETQSLLSLFERQGIELGSADQSISAVLADPIVAEALELSVGSPLLMIERVVRDNDDRPVELINIRYRTDLYKYRMRMERLGQLAEDA